VSVQITVVLPNTPSDTKSNPILPSITILSAISVIAFVSILFRRNSNFH